MAKIGPPGQMGELACVALSETNIPGERDTRSRRARELPF